MSYEEHLDAEIDNTPIEEPNLATNYTHREKALRDSFVSEYLVDQDAYGAAIRVGYPAPIAKEYCVRFMQEPYVLQQIAKRGAPAADSPDAVEEAKARIIAGLTREANYRGAGSSQSARVAAFGKLASIYGMDAPTRTQTELTGPDGQPLNGGMFVVPGIISIEEWEKNAEAQQAALVAGTTAVATPVEIS